MLLSSLYSSVLRKPFGMAGKNMKSPKAQQKKMNQILSNRRLLTRISIEGLKIIINSLYVPGSVRPLRDTTDPTDYKLPSYQQEITKLSGWKNPKSVSKGKMPTSSLHTELAWKVTENPQFYIFPHLPLGITKEFTPVILWETEFIQINYGPEQGRYELKLGQKILENRFSVKLKEALHQSKSYDKLWNTLIPKNKAEWDSYSPEEKKLLITSTMLGDKELKRIMKELKKFT